MTRREAWSDAGETVPPTMRCGVEEGQWIESAFGRSWWRGRRAREP